MLKGMRVLIFSDIHGDTRALEKLVAQPADIYISAGDLSTFGRALANCGEILRPLGEDRKSTRLNSSHIQKSRMPSSA